MNIEELESNLTTIHEWIKSADQKASIFVAISIGLLAFGGNEYVNFMIERLANSPLWLILLSVICIVTLGWSIVKALLIIKPSLSNNATSVTFFGHIAQWNLKTYRKKINAMNKKDYWNEITEQIVTTSKIAQKKHSELSESIALLLIHALGIMVVVGLTYVS